MLLRLAYLGVTNVFALLRLLPMSNRDKDAEILALRHQLSVLQRQLGPDRVRFTPGDRALLASQSDAADGRRRDRRRQRIALSRNGPPVCAPARFQATETASGRSRVDQAVPSLPPWLLSLITAGQRDADVLAMSRCACRQLTPERRHITWLVT